MCILALHHTHLLHVHYRQSQDITDCRSDSDVLHEVVSYLAAVKEGDFKGVEEALVKPKLMN